MLMLKVDMKLVSFVESSDPALTPVINSNTQQSGKSTEGEVTTLASQARFVTNEDVSYIKNDC